MVDLEPEKELSKPTDSESLLPVTQGPRTIRMQLEQKPVLPKPKVAPIDRSCCDQGKRGRCGGCYRP